jgi:hypothetical protein
MANSPWAALPRQIAPLMRLELADLSEEITGAIQRNIPEFGRPQDSAYIQNIRLGVERALSEFVDRVADPSAPWQPDADAAAVYRALGRGEMREGRNLDALQAAYRLGGRLAWRRWVRVGQRAKVPPAQMYRLAEAVFAHVDELAAESIEGFTEAQARVAGEMQRRRKRLLEVLLSGDPVSPQVIADLARAARWPLPDSVAAVALEHPPRRGQVAPVVLGGLGEAVLVDLDRPDPYLLVPDPEEPGRLGAVDRALRSWSGAVGPPMGLTEAAMSLYWARRMLELTRRGLGTADRGPAGNGVVHCTDHLLTLVLLQDEDLVQTLAARRLAPMAHLTPKQQARMAETLLAWLECGGRAPEVARRIHVHPQTVRYRLRQIEDLFGGQLHDPDARFELEIVLRAHRLLGRLPGRRAAVPGGVPGARVVAGGPGQSGPAGRERPERWLRVAGPGRS